MVNGDFYYKMYDGEIIYFMGMCKYMLIKLMMFNDFCGFYVIVKNEYRNKNICVVYMCRVMLKILGKSIGL